MGGAAAACLGCGTVQELPAGGLPPGCTPPANHDRCCCGCRAAAAGQCSRCSDLGHQVHPARAGTLLWQREWALWWGAAAAPGLLVRVAQLSSVAAGCCAPAPPRLLAPALTGLFSLASAQWHTQDYCGVGVSSAGVHREAQGDAATAGGARCRLARALPTRSRVCIPPCGRATPPPSTIATSRLRAATRAAPPSRAACSACCPRAAAGPLECSTVMAQAQS